MDRMERAIMSGNPIDFVRGATRLTRDATARFAATNASSWSSTDLRPWLRSVDRMRDDIREFPQIQTGSDGKLQYVQRKRDSAPATPTVILRYSEGSSSS